MSKFVKVFDKMSKLYVFDISWNIFSEKKGNLDKKCVKRGFFLSWAKLEQLPLIATEKTVVFHFWPYFPPVST